MRYAANGMLALGRCDTYGVRAVSLLAQRVSIVDALEHSQRDSGQHPTEQPTVHTRSGLQISSRLAGQNKRWTTMNTTQGDATAPTGHFVTIERNKFLRNNELTKNKRDVA